MVACGGASGQSHAPSKASPGPLLQARRSRSAPSLPHAYNLRQYSVDRGHIARSKARVSHPLSHVDLLGGNGQWRQKRAKEQWVIDQVEAEKERRERQVREDEKRKRREEREARRRKQQEEEQQRQRVLQEKERRERLAQEERERQEEEERRLKAQQEENERLARQPKTCTTCMGSGKCSVCDGKGFFFAFFLAPSVSKDTVMDFGRAQQGCPECGGCAQNIRGALVQGSGDCYKCDGVGKVAPSVVDSDPDPTMKPRLRAEKTRSFNVGKARVSSDSVGLGHSQSTRSPMSGESTCNSGELSP